MVIVLFNLWAFYCKAFETWELHPAADFYSFPFQFYKKTGSQQGLQQRGIQMTCVPFATAVEWKLIWMLSNWSGSAKQRLQPSYLSLKENLSNKEDATTL